MNLPRSNHPQASGCIICTGPVVRHSTFKEWVVFKCKQCGFGQTNVTDSDIAGFYESEYFGGNTARFSQSADEEISDSKKWWLDKYVQGPSLKCLEIGPGPAAMVPRYLSGTRHGFSYSAVEISLNAGAQLRNRGYEVHTGRIYDEEVRRGVADQFDCVVATEVIEHDRYPRAFVSGIFNALKPGGSACLTTGNFDGIMARVKGSSWYYLDLPAHVCFYTPRSVLRLFKEIGFRSVRIDCIGFNYIRLYQRVPLPGLLAAVHWLQLPTGMTICARK